MKLLICLSIVCVALATSERCDRTRCPNYITTSIYRDLKCRPLFNVNDRCCPDRYDCPNYERMINVPDKCHYRDQMFSGGESIPSEQLSAKCGTVHCTCYKPHDETENRAKFVCAHNDCPEFFRATPADCRKKYSLDYCCSVGEICGDAIKDAPKCLFEGKSYIAGERVYSETNKCKQCLCSDDGTVKCKTTECDLQLNYAEKLLKYCAPYYSSPDQCCPYHFICPDSPNVSVVRNTAAAKITPGYACNFGKELLNIGDTVKITDPSEKCTKCVCSTPPLVTCYPEANCIK